MADTRQSSGPVWRPGTLIADVRRPASLLFDAPTPSALSLVHVEPVSDRKYWNAIVAGLSGAEVEQGR